MAFGKVTSSKTGTAVAGAHVMEVAISRNAVDLFEHNYNGEETRQPLYEYTDSTGNFLHWDFGFCMDTRFFIVVSKGGYHSQAMAVETFSELEIALKLE